MEPIRPASPHRFDDAMRCHKSANPCAAPAFARACLGLQPAGRAAAWSHYETLAVAIGSSCALAGYASAAESAYAEPAAKQTPE